MRRIARCLPAKLAGYRARRAGSVRRARAHQSTSRAARQAGLPVWRRSCTRQGDATNTPTPRVDEEIVSKGQTHRLATSTRPSAWRQKMAAAASSASPDSVVVRIVHLYAAPIPTGSRLWPVGPTARSYFRAITPLDVASQIEAPILGLYGGADGGIPNDTVEKYGAALKAAGNTRSEMVIFPNMPHAFYADYRPSYRKEAADDGWKRLTAWFKQYLS